MRISLIVFLVLITSCKQPDSDWIDRTKHEGLFDISMSGSFETYCSEQNPEDIKNTVDNLKQAKEYFDKTFREDLNFAVLFVDNPNWNKYAFTPPPGMPQAHHQGNMVLGLGNSVMATRALQGLKQAPDSKLDILKQHFGEELNLDLFFRDALSLHELGHLYQFYKTGKGSQRHWLNEIFGNLCQVAAAKNLATQDVFNRMDVYQLFLIDSNQWGELKFKSLNQFEKDYFEVFKQGRNYGWYQSQFYLKAKKLYSKFGDEFLNEFRDFLIDINPEKVGKLSDKELKELMTKTFSNEVVEILEWKHDS
ncbi:MAG: hypothetical protein HKN51_14205 [Saprospiraceae bacterium]|nr:hypothetical protein [Saprospiraceae bacterium]